MQRFWCAALIQSASRLFQVWSVLPALALAWVLCAPVSRAAEATYTDLRLPQVGDFALHVLSPTVLELARVNTRAQSASRPDSWDWVNDRGEFAAPDLSSLRVTVDGQAKSIAGSGFKRRPLYAALWDYDLRLGNYLYLQLATPVLEGQEVQVQGDTSLWPTNMKFSARAEPLRYSPAIHVNQEGYLPDSPKKGMVGYYLGSLGEMPIAGTGFAVVDAKTGATAYEGSLTARPDFGYLYSPTPYQKVYEADFSALNAPGAYRLKVAGLGASLPFRIDGGIALGLARTYALGMLHQRSGFDVAMPFTRFVHGADHTASASVPVDYSDPFKFTWDTVWSYATVVNPDNPPQTAPRLTGPEAQLYPFINRGPVDVSGGHFEAANYSKVTWNNAQVIHTLMFAVDSLPGVGALDNLGIPESGDGISDALQEAKWEADCLAKLQDADGGFYYMIHPQHREYENDVLPENGDPQVVWPKNTASTAAAVAALAQCASSPRFKQAYPQAVSNYWAKAMLGWRFLTNALAVHGEEGAYQRVMHFDDAFTHVDDLAWAACELFVATGDAQYRAKLEHWLPDPTDPGTARWGWWHMFASYGNAIRSYAAAARSGRLQAGQLNADYQAKCVQAIVEAGDDNQWWSQANAYGSSFPLNTKFVRDAGWYYSTEQAFDMVVAQEFNPNPAYVDAILQNVNFETGCNPVNVTYLTGLGWKRQREVVDQYSDNDRRELPKIGVPIGNIQSGFVYTWTYGNDLSLLCSPSDGADSAPYPFYDRWCDFWNVSTEASTTGIARSYVVSLWLAARSGLAGQPWRFTRATIPVQNRLYPARMPVTLALSVEETNLAEARITWEARGQEPVFGGTTYTFTPPAGGAYWVEAEVQWPDGRRAFATNSIEVDENVVAPEVFLSDARLQGDGFSFRLTGAPNAAYVVQVSSDMMAWTPLATNALPSAGTMVVTDPAATNRARYYRAVPALSP